MIFSAPVLGYVALPSHAHFYLLRRVGRLRSNPHLYEVNARLFLRRMVAKHGRPLTLAEVPETEWASLAQQGFDVVWLMGAWKRSPGARRVALCNSELRRSFDQVLPAWVEDDVDGSPYAVGDYVLAPELGAHADLGALRRTLQRHGLALFVDFVPNHLALDHAWTIAHPDRFVRGDAAMHREHPEWFFSPQPQTFLAHGRDPNFAPWIDTVQVNFFCPDLRRAHRETLLRLAELVDGVRCDMAMLALTQVFERTWGRQVDGFNAPASEYWEELTRAVRQRFPDFVFMAEAYWGLENELLDLGFDFVYDKSLYDKLRWGTAADVHAHLARFPAASRAVRFVENHDEPRVQDALGRERAFAAATVVATVPGMRLFHDGQLQGRRIRLPVQLVREPHEPVDAEVQRRSLDLLKTSDQPVFHDGTWELLEAQPAGDDSHRDLLAWTWHDAEAFAQVVVNYSDHASRGRVAAPDGEHLLDLGPWQTHIVA